MLRSARAAHPLELYTLDRRDFVFAVGGYQSRRTRGRLVDDRLRAFTPAGGPTA
jgi:hypothetical protein